MKQFIVQQSIDVAMCYVIEAESLEQAEEMMFDGCYERSKIIDISVLNWDNPWEVMEAGADALRPLSEEELNKWDILGL
jgi:hypothetical protein